MLYFQSFVLVSELKGETAKQVPLRNWRRCDIHMYIDIHTHREENKMRIHVDNTDQIEEKG